MNFPILFPVDIITVICVPGDTRNSATLFLAQQCVKQVMKINSEYYCKEYKSLYFADLIFDI